MAITASLRFQLTHGGDDLSFQPQLTLKATGKVSDPSFAVSGNVRNLANMVEHVSADEEEDGNHATSGPKVTALHNGKNVWRG